MQKQHKTVYDLAIVKRFRPDILILKVGTNELSKLRPETVGSALYDFVKMLLDSFGVRLVVLYHVIPRGESQGIQQKAAPFNQYSYTRCCWRFIALFNLDLLWFP